MYKDSSLIMTPQQLRTTNLIFLEHEKLKKELPILKNQIKTYQLLDSIYHRQDSIQNKHVEELSNLVESQDKKIKKLKKNQKLTLGSFILLIIGILCSK